MRRSWLAVLVVTLLAGYLWLAVGEARDREAVRPEPAPIGVTVDPAEELDPSALQGGGFDFAAVRWTPTTRAQAATATKRLRAETNLKYAFLVPGDRAGEETFDALAEDYAVDRWVRYRGKPLVYVFGATKTAADPRFAVVRIDNGPAGDQYWVANPPNIKHDLLTLAPSFVGGGLNIDPDRTGDALDQQELFAETNKDRTQLLLWHSWNVREDRSPLSPSLAADSVNPPSYAYDRVKAFNERWKRP